MMSLQALLELIDLAVDTELGFLSLAFAFSHKLLCPEGHLACKTFAPAPFSELAVKGLLAVTRSVDRWQTRGS